MPKLADLTAETRLGLKLGGALLAVIIIIFLGLQGSKIVRSIFFPAPPTAPEQKFGPLPAIQFPENEGSTSNITYQINTVSGQLPTLPDRLNVYEIVQPEPNLIALRQTRALMQELGFTAQEIKKSDTEYQFTKTNGESITYNILTRNFSLTGVTIPTTTIPVGLRDRLADFASDTIVKIGADTTDLDPEKTKIEYFIYNNGALIPTQKSSDGMVAQISFGRKAVEEIPIYYANVESGNLFFQITAEDNNLKTYRATYNHFLVNKDSFSSYPLKAAEAAFEDLQNGNAYVVNKSTNPVIDITDVKLGYYISEVNPAFLMPIIVFEGVNFLAYVPAIP